MLELFSLFRTLTWAEGRSTFPAGAKRPQVVVAVNSSRVPIAEIDLDGVVSDLSCALRAGFRLIHREKWRRLKRWPGKSILLFPLIIASRARAVISQVGKLEMARMAVRPANIHSHPGFHVNLDSCWLLTLVNRRGHLFTISHWSEGSAIKP